MMDEVRAIVREVAASTGVPACRIMSKERTAGVVCARREVILRLHKTGRSLTRIARLIGRDHAAVWHFMKHLPHRPRWRKPHIKMVRAPLRHQILKEFGMIGQYRIYPAWFTGREGHELTGSQTPMNELAQGSAKRMGRSVLGLKIVALGEDFRGSYVDFNVTYSSTDLLEKSS